MKDEQIVKKTFYEPGSVDPQNKIFRLNRNVGTTEKRTKDGDVKAKELKLLQARTTSVDLTADLKKTRIVNVGGSDEAKPGFYCKECDCTVMDSLNYLDHINGARHQQNLGLSMRVERSTPKRVQQRIIELKKRKNTPVINKTFEERIKMIELSELEEKKERKRLRKEQKAEKAKLLEKEAAVYTDEECVQLMGFGNFGSKFKK